MAHCTVGSTPRAYLHVDWKVLPSQGASVGIPQWAVLMSVSSRHLSLLSLSCRVPSPGLPAGIPEDSPAQAQGVGGCKPPCCLVSLTWTWFPGSRGQTAAGTGVQVTSPDKHSVVGHLADSRSLALKVRAPSVLSCFCHLNELSGAPGSCSAVPPGVCRHGCWLMTLGPDPKPADTRTPEQAQAAL